MEGALGRGPEQNPQAEILQRLESAVGAIQDSESFRKWLDVSSRFHTYSLGNQLLIAAQRPDATRVAGFQAWLKLGRHVRRGEKGIKIIVPRTGKFQNDDGTEERLLTGFGVGHVFDIRQTEGDPLPEFSVPTLDGEEGHELWEGLRGFALSEGISVRVVGPDELPRNVMGYYSADTKEIVVGAHGQRQRTKTLAHELGHHMARVDDRAENECIAEGIAYVVCAHFGVDTGERSFPYVAGWAQNKPVLRGVLTTIHSASAGIIAAVERIEPCPGGDAREAMTFLGQARMQLENQAPAGLEGAASIGGDIQLLDSDPGPQRFPKRGVQLTLSDLEIFDPASRPGRRERRFCCPLPACAAKPRDANHRSLSLSLTTGLWHCHRCGLSGCLAEDQRDPGRLGGQRGAPRQPVPESPDRAMGGDNTWRRHLRDSVLASNTLGEEYLASRGIPVELTQRSGVRYSPTFFARPAVLFPLTDAKGNLVAVHGRYVDGEEPRMRTAGPKREGLYRPDRTVLGASVAIAEAPIDALSLMALGIASVAICGTSWPEWLPTRLRGKRVLLAFDADEPGDAASEALAKVLTAAGVTCTRLRPVGAKDWNDALRAGHVLPR